MLISAVLPCWPDKSDHNLRGRQLLIQNFPKGTFAKSDPFNYRPCPKRIFWDTVKMAYRNFKISKAKIIKMTFRQTQIGSAWNPEIFTLRTKVLHSALARKVPSLIADQAFIDQHWPESNVVGRTLGSREHAWRMPTLRPSIGRAPKLLVKNFCELDILGYYLAPIMDRL